MARRLSIRIQRSLFDIEDWECQSTAAGVDYRPGGVVLMWRIATLVVCVIMMAGLLLPVPKIWHQLPSADGYPVTLSAASSAQKAELDKLAEGMERILRERVSEERWLEIQAELRAKQAARQVSFREQAADQRKVGLGLLAFYLLLPTFFGCVAIGCGLLPLLRHPVERMQIQRTAKGELEVSHRGLLRTSVVKIPLGDLSQLSWYAKRIRSRYYRAWVWQALIIPRIGSGQNDLAFSVERQKHKPDMSVAPESVQRLLEKLQRITSLPIKPPRISVDPAGRRRTSWQQTVTAENVETQEYNSLEEMPADVRAIFDRMQADPEAKKKGMLETFRVTVRDHDGNVRTYTRLEDVPPEIRQTIEERRKKSRP